MKELAELVGRLAGGVAASGVEAGPVNCRRCRDSGLYRDDRGRVYTCTCDALQMGATQRAGIPKLGEHKLAPQLLERLGRWVERIGQGGGRAVMITGREPRTFEAARWLCDRLPTPQRFVDVEDDIPMRVSDLEPFVASKLPQLERARVIVFASLQAARWEQVEQLGKLLKQIRRDRSRAVVLCGRLSVRDRSDVDAERWARVMAELERLGACEVGV